MKRFSDYLSEATSPIDGEAKNSLKDIQKRLETKSLCDWSKMKGVDSQHEAACKAIDAFIKAAFK